MTTTTTKRNRTPEEQVPLFDNSSDDHSSAESSPQDAGGVVSRSPHADDSRCAQTRNSMLWAAYADALGFISELVDHKGLKRRTKGAELDRLMAWRRRVGGRGGVDVVLPAGCWSDDTQLRMAVSRTITHHGFDIETFSALSCPSGPPTPWEVAALPRRRPRTSASLGLCGTPTPSLDGATRAATVPPCEFSRMPGPLGTSQTTTCLM